MRCREERSARRRLPTALLSPPRRWRGCVLSGGKGDEALVLEASRRLVPSVELHAKSFASERRHQPVIDDRTVQKNFDDVDGIIVAVSVRL
jgi:hypothetical protein